jgi:hypothetical protein
VLSVLPVVLPVSSCFGASLQAHMVLPSHAHGLLSLSHTVGGVLGAHVGAKCQF